MEINFSELSIEEIKQMNEERAERVKKSTNDMLYEVPVVCPVINDLRYNHHYWLLNPFLINNDGLKFEMRTDGNKKEIHLAFIGVPVEMREQGYGHEMMETLTNIADKYGYTIDLEVVPKFGIGKRILKGFYKKHGFVKDDRPYRGNDHMIRFAK